HSILSLFFQIRPPPCSPLFPYTTLFRSRSVPSPRIPSPYAGQPARDGSGEAQEPPYRFQLRASLSRRRLDRSSVDGDARPRVSRSEEHTSELQSQSNLVCRLLLEKKNRY